jgi:hypothetical protein
MSVSLTEACGKCWLRSLKLPGNDGLILKLALDEIYRLDVLINEVSKDYC